MHILFGTALDGCPAPSCWQGLGRLVCGENGLIRTLETALGLPPASRRSPLERLVSYREALARQAGSNRRAFFTRSLEVEGVSTAGTLLRWRDELLQAGWNPCEGKIDEMPPRLRDLAETERRSPKEAAFQDGTAEPLAQILAALRQGGRTGIDSIIAIDPPDSLPRVWRSVLTELKARFDPFVPSEPVSPPGTALHILQSRLLQSESSPKSAIDLRDGTVAVVSAFCESPLARAAARKWEASRSRNGGILIASLDDRSQLNEAFRSLDLPLITDSTPATAQTLAQLVLLSLRLHWAPFDPQAWLEFLLHPVCPLAGSLRFPLAEAIHRVPGRANGAWNEAVARALTQADSDSEPGRRDALKEQIDAWLNILGYDRTAGAPGHALASTADRLASFMSRIGSAKAGDADPCAISWSSMSREVQALAGTLAQLDTVTEQELERLSAVWLSSLSSGPTSPGELGSIASVCSPGQILEPIEHVLWWKPAVPVAPRSPWTRAERDWLAGQGAEIVEPEAALVAGELDEKRAILNATRSVTLFVAAGDRSDTATPPAILTRLLAEVGNGILRTAAESVFTTDLPVHPLPEPRRWWQLSDPALLQPRETESYSSLAKVIYSPYQWVLDRQARLRKGRLLEFGVADDSKRRGILLHDLTGRLFAPPPGNFAAAIDWRRADEVDLRSWIANVWPSLLEERAAQYLLPGNESARNRLLHDAERALWDLVRHLQSAGATSVEVEKRVEGIPFCGGHLNGYIDLVGRTPNASAVIDLKLGGTTGREVELKENRHLQLAVYGRLLHSSEGSDPFCAFFVLGRGGTLLARSTGFFPSAIAVRRKNEADATEWTGCWAEFERVWHWRRGQFDAGRIEITVAGTLPDEIPPLEHWQAPQGTDRYNDYNALTGWPRTA